MKHLFLDLLQKPKLETGVGTAFGGASAAGHAIFKMDLLQINWSTFAVNLAQKTIEVAIVSAVGAIIGFIATRFAKTLFKEKP